ncbi:MAG: hypothetical protein QF885_01030 [Candidatus Thalassarchaeaceae archaeon]|nr:hypothetical protein [Candidatus Thalassarchaeaceae archaeon]
MHRVTSGWPATTLILVFLISSCAPVIAQGVGLPDVSIHIDWLDQDENGEAEHAYVIEFSSAPIPSDWRVELSHSDANGTSLGNWTYRWGDANYSLEPINSTHYRVVAPNNISFGDSIDVEVWLEMGNVPSATRTIDVTQWNQPLADHEITVTTDWTLRHIMDNITTNEYLLDFTGQGWQARSDGVLIHDELGSGNLTIDETSEDGANIYLVLNLNRIWLNETMEGSELTSQIFEMAGTGNMTVTSENEGENTTIEASVVDSYILRSMIGGVIEEQMRLEANGNLNISSVRPDAEMYIDGEVSLLLVEMHDVDGVRILDHTQFEATAEMEMETNGSYIYIDLEQLYNIDREENGVMVLQHSKFLGDGTFYFSDTNDDNGSIVIDGDVLIFHQESVNGTKTADSIHIDADITGATTGEFGVLRRIDGTGQTANSTGAMWEVNRIHEENWFNLTGGGVLEGMGPSQYYNETWDHEVIYENYTNRTIYFNWYEQSDDPSQGEEWPEESPIPMEEENETTDESGLGDVDISRESGLAPSELLMGDNLGLYSGDVMDLELTAHSYQSYTRDGHTMQVTSWSGSYLSDASTANGLVINEGILAGLIAEVSREVYIDLNTTEDAWFWENQSLERVLSPNIVTAGENTPPSIVDVRLHEGRVVNEGGNLVHIEVEVEDPDWNLRNVTVDLTSLGLGVIELNDIGQDGDIIVHDDNFTGSFTYFGTDAGNLSIGIDAIDAWVSNSSSTTIEVTHRAPRLVDFTMSTYNVQRGNNLTVSAKPFDALGVASVAIDLRGEGGELFNLSEDGGGVWSGVVDIPAALSPGDLYLPVRLEDTGGGLATVTRLNLQSSIAGVGGDAWDAPTSSIPALHILNSGPEISDFAILKDGTLVTTIIVPDVGDGASTYVLTVNATDHDVITVVQGRLGMLAPVGQDTTWQTMRDDGQEGDAVAGDGVYSIEVTVREGLPTDTIELDFRGIDVYLTATEPALEVTVELSDEDVNPLTDPTEALTNWGSTVMIVLILLGIVMIGASVAIVIMLRRGGSLDEQLGLTNNIR